MANYRIKYVFGNTTKSAEGSRTGGFSSVQQAIARGTGQSAFGLRYSGASGDFAVDSDNALTTALRDAEATRKPYLRLVVTAPGGAGPAAPAYSDPQPAYQPPPQQQPAYQPQQSQPAAAPAAAAPAAAAPPANAVAHFVLPGTGNADKVKITPEQTESFFLFTPVPSKYQTDVTVVLDGTKLQYNNTYTFQDGPQLKTMNLTQTFNLPYAPRPDQVQVNGNQVKLLL